MLLVSLTAGTKKVRHRNYRVEVNGRHVKSCVAVHALCGFGVARYHVFDKDGQPHIIGDGIATRLAFGRIKVSPL